MNHWKWRKTVESPVYPVFIAKAEREEDGVLFAGSGPSPEAANAILDYFLEAPLKPVGMHFDDYVRLPEYEKFQTEVMDRHVQ